MRVEGRLAAQAGEDLATVVAGAVAQEAQWPGFRGPNRDSRIPGIFVTAQDRHASQALKCDAAGCLRKTRKPGHEIVSAPGYGFEGRLISPKILCV